MLKSRTSGAAGLAVSLLSCPAFADHVGASPAHAVAAETVTVIGPAAPALVPDADQARKDIETTPGAVEIVTAEDYGDSAARTLKDALDYSAGVFVQPKWGEDARLSIRGSGLSRNFHLRGVTLLVDGIPMNAADGSGDFQEIDPTAFAYTEVYKGANALRYGANSLGGALNFVSRTGHQSDRLSARLDGGSFGLLRTQVATGGRAGDVDAHLSIGRLEFDGFRDHSDGESLRVSSNLGLRLGAGLETRFYLWGGDIEQRIPGSLTRDQALSNPEQASAGNVALGYARDIQSLRWANKTTVQVENIRVEFGGYASEKRLIHPIFRYLDYDYFDKGGFVRGVFDAPLLGRANRLTLGANLFGGHVEALQFQNLPGGVAGPLLNESRDRARNFTLYAEEQFEVVDGWRLVAGLQYQVASRRRAGQGGNHYEFTSPKLGVLWQAAESVQVFANVSRSGEVPTFGELNFTNPVLSDTRAQRATTYELGSRGHHAALQWDVAIYHTAIDDEFQFFDLGGGQFSVTNADETVHQGLEAASRWRLLEGLVRQSDALEWKLAYSFNDFFFDDDAQWGSNELPGAPRHFIRSEWRYTQGGWYVAPHLEWVPRGYDVDNANSVQTRHYAIAGLRAGYEQDRWSVYVDARNLADEKYIASSSVAAQANANSALFEPGDGLAVYAGLALNW